MKHPNVFRHALAVSISCAAAYNTLNNHYQTIPTRYRTSVENSPSGLLGPVKIKWADTDFSFKRIRP